MKNKHPHTLESAHKDAAAQPACNLPGWPRVSGPYRQRWLRPAAALAQHHVRAALLLLLLLRLLVLLAGDRRCARRWLTAAQLLHPAQERCSGGQRRRCLVLPVAGQVSSGG